MPGALRAIPPSMEPGASLTEAEIIAYAKQHLAGYECPKRVELRDALPRTATGKLQTFLLRAPFWKGQAKGVH